MKDPASGPENKIKEISFQFEMLSITTFMSQASVFYVA